MCIGYLVIYSFLYVTVKFIVEVVLIENLFVFYQLNPNRQSKRRFPEQINNICQPFDENKFNFTKVSKEEILFTFKESDAGKLHSLSLNIF